MKARPCIRLNHSIELVRRARRVCELSHSIWHPTTLLLICLESLIRTRAGSLSFHRTLEDAGHEANQIIGESFERLEVASAPLSGLDVRLHSRTDLLKQ